MSTAGAPNAGGPSGGTTAIGGSPATAGAPSDCDAEQGLVEGPDGCVPVPPPRLLSPLSTASVTSRRPTLRWELADGSDGGRVEVCAKKLDGHLEVEVRDTGIGIAPDDQALVFEEFRQVGRDGARKAEGTGLGLALTKRFVELCKALEKKHGARFKPSKLLVEMAAKNETFYRRFAPSRRQEAA